MKRIFTWLTVIGSMCFWGCNADFDEVHEVTTLRVLAVAAEPPEITPGEGTTVNVLWADPEGDGRNVDFVWWFCIGQVLGGMLEGCEMIVPPVISHSDEEGGDQLVVPDIPKDLFENTPRATGVDSLSINVVGLLCADGKLASMKKLSNPDAVGHVDEYCKGGEAVSFYREILISESENPQQNPTIDKVVYQDDALVPLADDPDGPSAKCKQKDGCGIDVSLKLFMTDDSEQTYEVMEYGKEATYQETLFVSWFVTGGDFDDSNRSMVDEELHNTPEGPFEIIWKPKAPGSYVLYAVAHDTRGGAGYERYAFEIRSAN